MSTPACTDPALAVPAPAAVADEVAGARGAPGWRRLARPLFLVPAAFLLVVLACALFPGWIAPHDPFAPHIRQRLLPPGATYWLGTDDLGRDMLSRLVFGARTALVASFESVGLGVLVGVSAGLVAGYAGGWTDRIAMRIADVLQSIPAILLALALISVLGKGLVNAMLAVGVIFSITFLRITRAVVLAERERLYVDAARVLGLRPASVLLVQILPNVAAPLVVQASISLGTALLIEAMLSFLGVGADSTQVSWGAMLETARQFQAEQPLLPLMPGLAITFTVLAFNLLGDALREALLPHAPTADAAPEEARNGLQAAGRAEPPATGVLLEVRELTVRSLSREKAAEILSSVSLSIRKGEVLGLVGESGSGKSMTAAAILGLLPHGVHVTSGNVFLGTTELTVMAQSDLRRIRGARIGMVFQDPNGALSPVHTIGQQLADAVLAHDDVSRAQARERATELLQLVGVPDARRRLDDYPHQFSGGMAQRVVIAGALACNPELLVADEPTTALDVTIQAQVLDLLADLRQRLRMSVLLITHDLGVVADMCDRVCVMYAGQIVEQGEVAQVLTAPRHPYTRAVLDAMPGGSAGRSLAAIPGRVPPAWAWPAGCRFHPRCAHATERCSQVAPAVDEGVRCLRPLLPSQPSPPSGRAIEEAA
ncbi:MAG: dipeptide/oligopeptide/nickel ABC transporter permease/ATP-binding protein [Rubrivivax sp.]